MTTERVATKILADRANTVSVFDILRDEFKMRVPNIDPGSSWKISCPFAFEHADGGMDKNCRVYGTGNLYCFAQHGQLTPVRIFQMKYDLSYRDAAMAVLEAYNLARPRPYWERFKDLLEARTGPSRGLGELQSVVDALHLATSQHPLYAERQYSPEFMAAMNHELRRLDAVVAQVPPSDLTSVISLWYSKAKASLWAALDEGTGEDDD